MKKEDKKDVLGDGVREAINVFDELAKLPKAEVMKMVEIMVSETDGRMEAIINLPPKKVGVYYAAYGRYVAPIKPYEPTEEQLGEIIGLKLSVMTDVMLEMPDETDEEKNLKNGVLWALDSSIMADICQMTEAIKSAEPSNPTAEDLVAAYNP